MNGFVQDLRRSFRSLSKSRGFVLVSVATLALGIGANTAIFSVVDAVLLKPLGYPDSGRLVFLGETSLLNPNISISMADFRDWTGKNTTLENLGAYRSVDAVLTGKGEPEHLSARQVSAGLFPTLGVKPVLGRTISAADDRSGAPAVVVLGERFWARHFHRDPNVLGRSIDLDAEPYTVVGVVSGEPMHESLRRTEVFTSLYRHEPELGGPNRRGNHPGIYAYGRLKRGVTAARARADMARVAADLAKDYPDTNRGIGVRVQPLLSAFTEDVRPALVLLLAVVGFVLLIACANTANLTLARGTERSREIAVRLALGARPGRLLRMLLTESVLLALAGGAAGLALAAWVVALIRRAAPAGVPRIESAGVDFGVLAFAFGLSLATGILFGLAPALQVTRATAGAVLKESAGWGTAGRRGIRLRDTLVAGEVFLSLLLLVGAGLLARSLVNVIHAESGFDPTDVYTAGFDLPEKSYPTDASRSAFVAAVVRNLQKSPGVVAAGMRNPLFGGDQTSFIVEGRPIPKPGQFPTVDTGQVTPGALRAMGVRLLAGRYFDEHDDETAPPVCIVDETFAKTYWPGQNAIGRRGSPDGGHGQMDKRIWLTVVGIVSHVKNYGVDRPSRVEMYAPIAQFPAGGGHFVVKTRPDAAGGVAAAVRGAVHEVDPDVALFEEQRLSDIVADRTAPRRLAVLLTGALALLALLLASIGIYGVMSYAVGERRREIGIRIALGADRLRIFRMVVGRGAAVAAAGIAAGLFGGLALAPLVRSQLFGVSAHDPLILAVCGAWLLGIALVASFLPARRATRVDPLSALRYE